MGSSLSSPSPPPLSLLPVTLLYPVGKHKGEIRVDPGESLGAERYTQAKNKHFKSRVEVSGGRERDGMGLEIWLFCEKGRMDERLTGVLSTFTQPLLHRTCSSATIRCGITPNPVCPSCGKGLKLRTGVMVKEKQEGMGSIVRWGQGT